MIGTVHAVVGRPVSIKGMASDYDKAITHVEFSLDGGEHWTSYETKGATPERILSWNLTYTPPESGFYRMLVRSVNEDGTASPQPADVLVDAR